MRILVVEDNKEMRDFLEKSLQSKGYKVETRSNGDEAWKLLERGERFDLVITDVVMPVMDGMELLRRIKDRFPTMGVIVITGYGSINQAVEAMKLGASDYIPKPVELNQLLSAVEGVLTPAKAMRITGSQLSAMLNMSVLLHTLPGIASLKELLERIADYISDNFSPDGFVIAIFDEEKQELEVKLRKNIPGVKEGDRIKLVPREEIVREVVMGTETELPAPIEPERYQINLPLAVNNRLVGLLTLAYKHEPKLDHKAIQFMKLFTYQAAIAISNAMDREALRRTLKDLERLEVIGKELAGRERADEIISYSLEEASDLLGADVVSLTILPAEPKFKEMAGIYVLVPEEEVPLHIDNEIRRRIEPVVLSFFGGESGIILSDLPTLPVVSSSAPDRFPERINGFINALLIKGQGEIVGIVSAMSEYDKFDRVDVRLLQMMGYDIAIALQRAAVMDELRVLNESTIRSLARAVEARDPYTLGHSERVAEISVLLGRRMGLDEEKLDKLRVAGLLHDIGKIGVPDWILNKKGKLTEEDYSKIKEHPNIGASILQEIPPLREIVPWVRHHHERVDGNGYPDGLKGEEIPLEARILAVADAFDAMTSDRVYRPAFPLEKVMRIMEDGKDKQWDGKIVDILLEIAPSLTK